MPTFPRTPTTLRDDLCAFCRRPSWLNELDDKNDDDDDKKKKKELPLKSKDVNNVCPACLNCFSFFSSRSSAPSKTSSRSPTETEEEEEDKEDKDKAVVVSDVRELAKHLVARSNSHSSNAKRRKRVVQNGERVCVELAFPPSVAFRQSVAREILLREGEEGKEGEDVIDSDEEKESVNMARIQQQQQKMRVLDGDFDAMAREAREAAMLMVRAHSGCERVEHVRDKAKATVMVYVEYEGVPSAASFTKKSDFDNEDGERDDGTLAIQTTNVSLEDDFKAMRHFNVKRPNDRQKNWKKRKRREGRKPEWELVLSQPEPKYLAAFEDSRLEYSRVRKETSTDGFLRVIKNATTETLMSALYNNTYKAVRMKQDEEKKENPIAARVRVWASPVYVAGRYAKFARDVPQSPWSNCPVKWARATESVQDALEDAIVKSAHADGAKFNSSGREDLDVRMLGDGRPFVLEVHNPKASVSELQENLVRAETLMNQSSFLKTDVKAYNLRVVPKETYKNVGLRLDSNEKEKSYSCVCICDPPVPMDSTICDVVSAMKDVELKQQTPIRVSHRRSDLVRPRTLREIKVTVVPGTRGRCVYVDLRAEAGTYIKEFCHGDKGRTNPSLGDLLGNGTKCDIIQLDVTKVDAVGFDDQNFKRSSSSDK